MGALEKRSGEAFIKIDGGRPQEIKHKDWHSYNCKALLTDEWHSAVNDRAVDGQLEFTQGVYKRFDKYN